MYIPHRSRILAVALATLSLIASQAFGLTPFLPSGWLEVTTVPANGDTNPYGVAFVPSDFPNKKIAGDILVSNFNDVNGTSGAGSTIVHIPITGVQNLPADTFYNGAVEAPNFVGLTTALVVLKSGVVVVGQLPVNDNSDQGHLIFINSNGHLLSVIGFNPGINGPWDMTADDNGSSAVLFISNALNGTVSRINLTGLPNSINAFSVGAIAFGYPHSADPTVFLIGPTGLAYDKGSDTLFVASTFDNAIYKLVHAEQISPGAPVYLGTLFRDTVHMHGPLGLALTTNGRLITANGDAVSPAVPPELNSEILEYTTSGAFVGKLSVDPVVGAAFGLAIAPPSANNTVNFAFVNDGLNTLDLLTVPKP
jgi:hypothetical protein